MTTQIQKQKYKHIFEWAEKQFGELVQLFTKKKSEIILETASRLEKEGCEESNISNEITTNLSDYIDDSYIRKVLKSFPQYKEGYRSDNAKKRNSSRNSPAKPESPTIEAPTAKIEPTNKALPVPEERTLEGIENDGDDVFNRIIDNANDPNSNKPQGMNPDWYKSESQRADEARRELEEWNTYCEEKKKKETPIERYCNKILGIKPNYEKTFEEYNKECEDSWNHRMELCDEYDEKRDLLYEKPDGMTVKEWKEQKRLIKLEHKQKMKDTDLEITSTPNWLIKETIDKIHCDCMAEGIRNGVTCDTCKLLVKVNDYMMNLFKDAAGGRSSVI